MVTESCLRMKNLDFLILGRKHYKPAHCTAVCNVNFCSQDCNNLLLQCCLHLFKVHFFLYNNLFRIQQHVVEPYFKIRSRTAQLRRLQVLGNYWWNCNYKISGQFDYFVSVLIRRHYHNDILVMQNLLSFIILVGICT